MPELDQSALNKITAQLETTNLVDTTDNETLDTIGTHVVQVYEEDVESREGWITANEQWLKLATQVMETKSYPWPNASNVKYPLLSTAALQFNARAYPALLPDAGLVKTRVVGKDENNQKAEKGARVSTHMSYQLLEEDEDWSEDMDRLLYVLPIIGLAYKKSYYSPLKKRNVSKLIMPDDLVINYYAEDYERAVKTHSIPHTQNEIYELMEAGHYTNIELRKAEDASPHKGIEDELIGLNKPTRSVISDDAYDDRPYDILEQHTWWDLDGDGYKEPYIITVDFDSKKVLRIVSRWDAEGTEQKPDGTIVRITPTEYFTPYGFIPNPESKIYYLGFGSLLGPLNSASNTILNQLIDAGHLATLQGGFLGKGVRIRGGKLRFKPGEWQQVQSTGDDLRKNIYPLPVKEPSSVLFQLLGLLLESGERLAAVKDVMVGENPGQNQPYATTVAVLEQGMKVFVGIYKRIYRSMKQEYKKLFRLNSLYLDAKTYMTLLDMDKSAEIAASDYDIKSLDIIPAADPSLMTEAQKMLKADSLLQKKAAGLPLNTMEVTKRVLEVEGHNDVEKLLEPEPKQEDPELVFRRSELAVNTKLAYDKLEADMATKEFEVFKDYAQALSHLAKAAATESTMELNEFQSLAQVATDEYKAITERLHAVTASIQTQQTPETTETKPTETTE